MNRNKEYMARLPKEKRQTFTRRCNLRRFYGISIDTYESMLERQRGVCAICGQPPGERRLAVDHKHDTGTVRGLLCEKCNRGLGLFRDDQALLRAAADYLDSKFG